MCFPRNNRQALSLPLHLHTALASPKDTQPGHFYILIRLSFPYCWLSLLNHYLQSCPWQSDLLWRPNLSCSLRPEGWFHLWIAPLSYVFLQPLYISSTVADWAPTGSSYIFVIMLSSKHEWTTHTRTLLYRIISESCNPQCVPKDI